MGALVAFFQQSASAQASSWHLRWQDEPTLEPWNLHAQSTVVTQWHPAFHSPYSGVNSLQGQGQWAVSFTGTIFLAGRPWTGGQFVFNPEVSAGTGLSSTHGLAGFPNAEIYRVDRPAPRLNWSRMLLQQTFRLGPHSALVDGGPNQLGGVLPLRRLRVVLGKFSLNDYFDNNAYAHDPRTQFLNWALMDTGAFDYAADTRGYTWGLFSEVSYPNWSVRLAYVLQPEIANGLMLDMHLKRAFGFNLEGEWRYWLWQKRGALRLLLYDNQAHMGSYRDAIAQALPNTAPDITQTRAYRGKRGGAIAWEQSLGGNHGVFVRLGYSDGRYETWAFTEIERSLALGLQLDGALWHRRPDRFGAAYVINGISEDHARYLARGGKGFMLGDGRLRRGAEQAIELYYAWCFAPGAVVTLDWQGFVAPGYNRDRGPVAVAALRLHFEI